MKTGQRRCLFVWLSWPWKPVNHTSFSAKSDWRKTNNDKFETSSDYGDLPWEGKVQIGIVGNMSANMINGNSWPGLTNFFCKGQRVNILGFEGHKVSIMSFELCHCNEKLAKDNV